MRVRPTSSARFHRAQLLIAALFTALIATVSITGFVWATKEVTVVVDGRTSHLKTQAATVSELLAEAGVAVDARDLVTPALDAPVADGATVLVRHAVPVIVEVGGERIEADVVGSTVADALVALGLDPGSALHVHPTATTALAPGMRIRVPDVFVRVVSEEATIAPPVVRENDPSLPRGKTQVVTAGRPGRELRVYRVLVSGGTEGARVLTATRTIVEPVPRVIAVGSGSRKAGLIARLWPPPSSQPPKGGERLRVVATGYSPEQPGLDSTTATGARARRGVVAVDPDVIPLGSRLYIPGYGYAVAADTGGAIDGRRIDLCFDSVTEALRWGRRTVTVIVLD